MFKILIVEDDPVLNQLLATRLKQDRYEVFTASDGVEAMAIMEQDHIDLVVTDIMMPGLSGIGLIQELRQANYSLPILIVTAKNQMEDLEEGFQSGADDYLVKPIRLQELSLRVAALFRRVQAKKELRIGNTVFHYDQLTVTEGDHQQELPKKEFYLIFKLLTYPNQIFTRLDLLDEIWGLESESDERNVDAHIKKLRKRFEGNPDFRIVTVRGLGYKATLGEDE
jgi:DNA-binding response OmpR family regulator